MTTGIIISGVLQYRNSQDGTEDITSINLISGFCLGFLGLTVVLFIVTIVSYVRLGRKFQVEYNILPSLLQAVIVVVLMVQVLLQQLSLY